MVKSCLVAGCNTHSKRSENASFFRIPQIISIDNRFYKKHTNKDINELHELTKRRHRAWLRAIKCGDLSETQLKNARVFISGDSCNIHN